MTIKITTDSTCDLPLNLLETYQINIVPINIQFGNTSYKENISITPTDFYTQIEEDGILPTTSQPSVGEFIEMYTSLAGQTDEIISIHVTSKLSGTYQSAKLAAEAVADKVKVYPIDSLAGSAGLGWMVYEAANLIAQGKSALEIQKQLDANSTKISIFFAVDNLKFAQMSGRVGKLTSALSSILSIKPIIGLKAGLIDVHSKVRSNKVAMKRIVDLTKEKVKDNPVNVGVVHALAPDRAEDLMGLAKTNLNIQNAFITDIAISLAVHFGPNTLGLVAYLATKV